MFDGEDRDYNFSDEADRGDWDDKQQLGLTTPLDGEARYAGDDEYDEDEEIQPQSPRSNRELVMKKLSHEQMIKDDIEARKSYIKSLNSVTAGPHPLEVPMKLEASIRRPMTVNEEIFLGLGIGENEKDPADARALKHNSQNTYLTKLNEDLAMKEAQRKAMKEDPENFHLRGRKPVARPQAGVLDIDPNAIQFGSDEAKVNGEKKKLTREWMVKAMHEAEELKAAKKRSDFEKRFEKPAGPGFVIGADSTNSKEIKKTQQLEYRDSLASDIQAMKRGESNNGLDISFTFGGKSRDDRPSTEDRRSKVRDQKSYRELLDEQMNEVAQRKSRDRAMNNAQPRYPPPYLE
jgi:hypothetical protein